MLANSFLRIAGKYLGSQILWWYNLGWNFFHLLSWGSDEFLKLVFFSSGKYSWIIFYVISPFYRYFLKLLLFGVMSLIFFLIFSLHCSSFFFCSIFRESSHQLSFEFLTAALYLLIPKPTYFSPTFLFMHFIYKCYRHLSKDISLFSTFFVACYIFRWSFSLCFHL